MALLFRLSKDGQSVYISESSSKKDFEKNATVMPVKEFMYHLPVAQREKVRQISYELSDLSRRKIGELDVSFDVYLTQYNSMNIYYYINGENYTYVEGGDYDSGGITYEQALKYCQMNFGYDFVKLHEPTLHKEGTYYYENCREISKERYMMLKNKIDFCTQIITFDKDLEKEFRKSVKITAKEDKKRDTKKH